MLHYYLTFSFHLKLALLTQLPTSNERKIPPQLKIKPAKFHNGGFTQDLYMHICSISVKFQLWKSSMNALKSVARTQRVKIHLVTWRWTILMRIISLRWPQWCTIFYKLLTWERHNYLMRLPHLPGAVTTMVYNILQASNMRKTQLPDAVTTFTWCGDHNGVQYSTSF